MTLFQLSEQDRLIAETLEENGGELTPELEQMLQENKELFPKKIDGYGAMLRKFQTVQAACDTELKRIQAIKRVATNAEKNMRKHILDTMVFFGYKKLEGEWTSMRVGRSTSLEVDEDLLLAQYASKIKALNDALPPYLSVEIKVSKTEIKNTFKSIDENGNTVLPAGCTLKENDTLTVK